VKPLRGLKRLGSALATIVIVAFGALAAIPFVIGADAVREAVQAEIRDSTGLEPLLRGDVSVSLFPSGSASFADVALMSEPEAPPALAAERLTAHLRFLPLLLGRIEVAEITLVRPNVLISYDAAGSSNWAGLIARLARNVKSRRDGAVSFSEIRLLDGVVRIQDEARPAAELFESVELSLAWPSITKSFGATGRFAWRGETIDASISLSDFLAGLAGERTGVKVRMTGSPLKLAFDGHFSHRPMLKIDGTIASDSPSLRHALQWLGKEPLPAGGFGRFGLKAQASVVGETVALTNVNLDLDGNAAEGVLTLTAGGRPQLHGTLAAEQVDITPYTSAIRLLAGGERDWSRAPIRLDGLDGMEFDVRLSAAQVALAGKKIGRTAVAGSLRGGKLVLTIGESQAFGGVLKGSVALAKAPEGANLKAQLQFANVDLEDCLDAVFGLRRMEGRGDLALSLESAGEDVMALARGLNGGGSLVALRGALTGLNLEQVLRRLERRPLSGAGDFRNGRTPFDRLAVTLKVVDGTAHVDDVKLEGAAVRLALAGSASIPARDLDLKGTASLIGTAAKDSAGTGFDLPFVVRGRWDDPIMVPDAQSLIRRSGAAQGLLNAVRGGAGREAVRQVIDQLTRGAEPPQVVAPAASPPIAQ
jgi:AsmA protein